MVKLHSDSYSLFFFIGAQKESFELISYLNKMKNECVYVEKHR